MHPQLIGQELLKRGFRDYFLYMFKLIEGRPFIVEKLHPLLFDTFQSIYDLKSIRTNINLPPRGGKTTLAEYFVTYAYAKNKRCNFIYTSFSQSLLAKITTQVTHILTHPAYRAMFPADFSNGVEMVDPLNEFWAEYLIKTEKQEKYTSRWIRTSEGGYSLFASIGSQITGEGAGIRNDTDTDFGGALIIDDPAKPNDMNSKKLRKKVLEYYQETLLSRLNSSRTPIVNIMQRLHVEDLSGYLKDLYNFNTITAPLVDENGNCQLPSQYSDDRLKELQINQYVWLSQYQQQPIFKGGKELKGEWFKYYPINVQYKYKRILITADTAMKTKENNDYSVFMVGGITLENKLHILDLWRAKWEAPELEKKALEIFEKYKFDPFSSVACSGLYIEDKASGTGLIQNIQRKGVPIKPLKPDNDKLTRVRSIASYIESGNVLLPQDPNYAFNPDLISECEAFSSDDSHLHDDQVDALYYMIIEGMAKNQVSILDYFMNEE